MFGGGGGGNWPLGRGDFPGFPPPPHSLYETLYTLFMSSGIVQLRGRLVCLLWGGALTISPPRSSIVSLEYYAESGRVGDSILFA